MNAPFSAASKRSIIKVFIEWQTGFKAQSEMKMLVFIMVLTIATSFVVEYVFMD